MKYLGKIQDGKDLVTKEFVELITGVTEAPYTEVEWVESDGKQFVYLDWKPPIATWGFEADFILKNAFNTTSPAWNASTNTSGWGCFFSTKNADNVNDLGVTTYGSEGRLRVGGQPISGHGLKSDKTRQTMKLIGTTLTKPNGATMTVTRVNETANKPYCNMTIFAGHVGLRRSANGNVSGPSTTRIYSLKFYDGTELKVDLVGAIRKKDGVTGLFDKVAKHFYPAPDMTYGDMVGDLGDKESILESTKKETIDVVVSNPTNTRMWRANIPELTQLEDGQKFNVSTLYAVSASTQTTELAGWDDTSSNSNVYLKITLAEGKTTDWIPVYALGAGRLTTQFATGAPLLLTYRENVFSGATATAGGSMIMRAFYAQPYYNTNTDTTYILYYMNPVAGTGGLKKYSLFMMIPDGRFSSFTTDDGQGTSKTKNSIGFVPGKIYYHWHSTSHAENGKCGNNCVAEAYGTVDLQYSGNQGATIIAGQPVYLVGTIGSDGLFYLDGNWITQAIPTTEDEKVYFYLGLGYGTTSIHLEAVNPPFKYINGAFRRVDLDALTVNNHTVNKDVPSDAVFTDTVTTVSTTGSGNAVTAISASNGAITATKGSTFLTSHQDISGKVNKSGDTMTGKLIVPATRIANTYYGISFGRTTGTPVETILYTGIKWRSSSHMPVVHITGYAYGLQSPVEFKIGFYIYNNHIGYCGVTNMGSWAPDVYLFKYLVEEVEYVAIGLAGQCYYLQLQADVQDEMGKFAYIVTDSSAWSWSFLGSSSAGVIPEPDSGVTCIQVPYKANILNPSKVNGHTVQTDVPSDAVFTDTKSDWNATSGNAQILNKPTIPTLKNVFGKVKVGSTTIEADTTQDTLELVAGSNVTLTPDATNDKVTIEATDTTYESKAAASGGTSVSLVTTGEKYVWNHKAENSVVTAGTSTTSGGLMSQADKTKLDGIAAGAEANVQSDWNTSSGDALILNKPTIPTLKNVFGKVKVGSTTIEADTTQDTLELVAGSCITLTPDATNDKVTISGDISSDDVTMVSSGTYYHADDTVDDAISALDTKVSSMSGSAIPGVIQMYGGSTAPSGWLLCDGSAVSRTTYSALFAVIGTTYGSGNGSTTFNLPDFKGRVPVGVGTGSATGATAHTLGQKAGNENAIVPYHNHGPASGTYFATGSGTFSKASNRAGTVTSGGITNIIRTTDAGTISNPQNTTYAGTSGNATGANMMPYLGINYIICTG